MNNSKQPTSSLKEITIQIVKKGENWNAKALQLDYYQELVVTHDISPLTRKLNSLIKPLTRSLYTKSGALAIIMFYRCRQHFLFPFV